jgi:hypothetical protein
MGGVILCCVGCPTAYCYECWPAESQRTTPSRRWLAEFAERKWEPRQVVWVHCVSCLRQLHDARVARAAARAGQQGVDAARVEDSSGEQKRDEHEGVGACA